MDFFREEILEGALRLHAGDCHPRDVMAYVAAHPHAIAFGSLSVPAQGVRFLPVEGVEPTAAVRTADYLPAPAAARHPRGARQQVQAFLDHVMSAEGQALWPAPSSPCTPR